MCFRKCQIQTVMTLALLFLMACSQCNRKRELELDWIPADSLLAAHQENLSQCSIPAPATIHLELARDTLALADANVLTTTITNNLNQELLLYNLPMFGAAGEPFPFEIYMVTPEGENWLWQKERNVRIDYDPGSGFRRYFWLAPGQSISDDAWLFPTVFAPEKYQQALHKLSPGDYEYFGVYKLPDQEGYGKITIYTDTAKFTYLPIPKLGFKHRRALCEMNSLSESFIIAFSTRESESLEKIINTNTSYSEAAHALLVKAIMSSIQPDAYQKFLAEKARFDELYPDSPFEKDILTHQKFCAQRVKKEAETDSIANILIQKYPNDITTISILGKLNTVSSQQVEGQAE